MVMTQHGSKPVRFRRFLDDEAPHENTLLSIRCKMPGRQPALLSANPRLMDAIAMTRSCFGLCARQGLCVESRQSGPTVR